MRTRIDICDAQTGEVCDFVYVHDTPQNVAKFVTPDMERYWQCSECDEFFVADETPYYEISNQPGNLFCSNCCPYRPEVASDLEFDGRTE